MSRILVIDADPGERLIVRSRMVDEGHDVAVAENGAQGLIEAREGGFDLIMLAADLGQGVDSSEVCRRLKSVPELSSIPLVVYATQPSTPEACERAYDAGCDAHVAKPAIQTLDRVTQVLLRSKRRHDEALHEAQRLAAASRRLSEERQRRADAAATSEEGGQADLALRELAAGHPDGVMIVDGRGTVRSMDRGACELFGGRCEGKTLGNLAPGSGLEAFVRDARTEAREGFRFDLGPHRGGAGRALLASVVPSSGEDLGDDEGLRVVLLLDVGRRRVAEEMLRSQEPGIPRHQLSTLLEAARAMFCPEAIVGRSEAAMRLRRRVLEVSKLRGAVLLRGERGTGKEFVARILHYSGTATGAYLQMRCSALSGESLENELFGYAEGAFPGAVADRPGLLTLAQDGTLYLAEVQELPLELQGRLLAVIERRSFARRGARRSERCDLRLVVSSSQNLGALVQQGRFHEGLFARLMGCSIQVPNLRERMQDVPNIVQSFVERFGRYEVDGLSSDAQWVLGQYDWPGNIGELEDCIEQACTRAAGATIDIEHLTRPLRDLYESLPDRDLIPAVRPNPGLRTVQSSGPRAESMETPAGALHKLRPWDITDEDPISLDHYEKKVLLRALHSCGGDKLKAAKLLNVGKSTLYRKLKRFDIK